MDIKSFIKKKKFKYGAAAVVFTCACIAAIIVFNVVFSALANTFLWSIDMTKSQLFTLSEESRTLLKDIDKKITITFCQPLDTLTENATQNLVYQCAKEYEKAFDNISVEYVDYITYPSKVERFNSSSTTKINSESIIISVDPTEDNPEPDYRVFTLGSLFASGSESQKDIAFDGERKFTSAILQLSHDSPIAYFSTGHGEETESSALWELFKSAGYDVRNINLKNEEFDPEAQVLIINNPKSDFFGADNEVNELSKITKFLDNLGNLMVFVNPETNVPNLEELLADDWGIQLVDATIKDDKKCLGIDALSLEANYPANEMSATLHKTLREMESAPSTVVRNARPLKITWGVDGSHVTDNLTKKMASSVLTTFDSAKAFASNEEADLGIEAPFSLMTLTVEQRIVDNVEYNSYVMVVGSTEYATNRYLSDSAYANDEILYSAMRFMGSETVPTGVPSKNLVNDALDITKDTAYNWTIAITVIAPVIIFAVGIVIQIRRKHL